MSILSSKPAGLPTEKRAGHPSQKAWASSLKKGTLKPAINKKKPEPKVVQAVLQPVHTSKKHLAGVQVIRHFGSVEELLPKKTTLASQPYFAPKPKPKVSATIHFTPAPRFEPEPPISLETAPQTLAPSDPADLEPAFTPETAPWAEALLPLEMPSFDEIFGSAHKPRPSRERIMISNPHVAQVLFGQHTVLREMLPEAPEIVLDSTVGWGRDCRVCLPSGEHLIPEYIPEHDLPETRARCMLSEEDEHFHHQSLIGRGFSLEYRSAAIAHAQDQGVKVKLARSCIEGGNCRIFRATDGKHRALVGRNSILLTAIALEKQGEFNSQNFREFAKDYAARIKTPSLDSMRIARNLRLFEEDKRNCEPGLPDSPQPGSRTLTKGGSIAELVKYWDDALEFEARIEIAKRAIANDLGIPLEHIAFLAQGQFHIDLECFNGSGDAVFVHSEQESINLLLSLRRTVRGKDAELLDKYIETARARLPLSEKLLAANKQAIEAIGCKAVPTAGNFETEGSRVNFMNSVLVMEGEEQVLMTNGVENRPLNHFLKADFQGRVEDHCPTLKILFVADQTALLQHELSENFGGLHCMTWKNPVD